LSKVDGIKDLHKNLITTINQNYGGISMDLLNNAAMADDII
jgi:hypothetical protein